MKQNSYFFAVDLGATSGRTIIGTITDGRFELEEVTRFPNNLIEQGGHYYWDIHALYFEIIRGLKEVASRGLNITSIGIDTWGVDFVLIGDDNAILRNPRAYRDPITFEAMDEYLKNVVSAREVYDITGIQFLNFNSIFQLYAMQKENNTALRNAAKILFVPDALSWMLTDAMVCEYTIASTSQLLDPRTKELDERLLKSIGLEREKFGRMVQPGTLIGTLTEEVQRLTGLGPVTVRIPVERHVVVDGHRDEGGHHQRPLLRAQLHQRRRYRGDDALPEEHLRHVALRALPTGVERNQKYESNVEEREGKHWPCCIDTGGHGCRTFPLDYRPR